MYKVRNEGFLMKDKKYYCDLKLTYTELNLMYEVSKYLAHEYHSDNTNIEFVTFLDIMNACKRILRNVPKYARFPFYEEVFTINLYAGRMVRFTLPFTHGVTVYEYCDALKKYQRCTSERLLKKINDCLHELQWANY